MIKVAINGAGRIGRAFLKLALSEAEVEVVAMNDLCDVENIIYLLKYDTAYGRSDFLPILAKDKKSISIYDKEIKYFSEKDPAILPWKDLEVDVVVESTGAFTTFKKAGLHIKSGAKRVVITAPVNEEKFETCIVTSNASCTTNAASPLIQILNEKLGIEKAILNTVHGYTASQSIVDGPNKKDWKEGRAAAQNIVPTSTGAATAVSQALPQLAGKFDG